MLRAPYSVAQTSRIVNAFFIEDLQRLKSHTDENEKIPKANESGGDDLSKRTKTLQKGRLTAFPSGMLCQFPRDSPSVEGL